MSPVKIEQLERIGGALCLDFVNTVDPRYASPRLEFLPDFAALVEWAEEVAVIDRKEARRLKAAAVRRPDEALDIYQRGIALREALFEVFRGRVHHKPAKRDFGLLNEELARSRSRELVAQPAGDVRRVWPPDDDLARVVWPIVESAADLLCSSAVSRVRECEGERCGWLFLDTSKAGRRRWCSMADCGNRAKAQRRSAASRS